MTNEEQTPVKEKTKFQIISENALNELRNEENPDRLFAALASIANDIEGTSVHFISAENKQALYDEIRRLEKLENLSQETVKKFIITSLKRYIR